LAKDNLDLNQAFQAFDVLLLNIGSQTRFFIQSGETAIKFDFQSQANFLQLPKEAHLGWGIPIRVAFSSHLRRERTPSVEAGRVSRMANYRYSVGF
jgi:hypothetical protein